MIFNARQIIFVLCCFTQLTAFALEDMSDEGLENVTGQNGVYLSGEIALNETGGPLAITDIGNIDPDGAGPMTNVWGTCAEKDAGAVARCGARLAVKTNNSEGYFVLDEMRGKMSFEGLTIRAREISATGDAGKFGGDEADFDGLTVLELGLPNEMRFENVEFTIAASSTARPTDAGFQQTNMFGVQMNGTINMQGNLLVFPTGTP